MKDEYSQPHNMEGGRVGRKEGVPGVASAGDHSLPVYTHPYYSPVSGTTGTISPGVCYLTIWAPATDVAGI